MHHSFIDRYSHLESPLHHLDPRAKILVFLGLIVWVVLLPQQAVGSFAACLFLLAVLMTVSRIRLTFFLQRCLVILPFLSLMVLPALFMQDSAQVTLADGVHLSLNGLWFSLGVMMKALLSVISVTLLVSTTPFPDLLKGLQYLKTPRLFMMLLAFMYRYLFLFMDEAMRLNLAKTSRSVGTPSRWFRLKTTGDLIGVLFLKTYERSEAVYLAMLSRGFTGEVHTLSRFRFTQKDVLFVLLTVAYCSLATIYV